MRGLTDYGCNGAACELVSWSFAGSGVSGVVEIFGTAEILETLGAGAVCEPASWSCSGSGAAGLVRTIGSGGSGGFFAEWQTSLEQVNFESSQISCRIFSKAPLLPARFLPLP